MNKRQILSLTMVMAVMGLGVFSVWRWYASHTTQQGASPGQTLYEQNCAVCHGVLGDGKGEAAYLLQPKPRKFRAGKFRLVTSQNLQPTRDDVFRTITNGMPGTAMPSWAHLPESDRLALADYVLKLNEDGWYDRGIESGYSKAEAKEFATEMAQPDNPISIPPEPPVTPEGLEAGRKYYLTACSKCHGENGEGKSDPTWRTAEGFPVSSRNFRAGVFKGGREGQQLFLRFFTGLPGTPMPSGKLSPEQVWHVVHYVQSLSDPAAQEQAQIRAKEILVKRVQTLPSGPDDAAWQTLPDTPVPLMPLWWRDGYISQVVVKAAQDGQRLAVRLSWPDATPNTDGIRVRSFPDGAAVQFSDNPSPPLFAMGAAGQVCYVWHWKALWDKDRESFSDVAQVYPRMTSDAYFGSQKGWQSGPLDDPAFVPALQLNNPVARRRQSSVEEANAAGFGTYTAQPPDEQNVQGASTWKDGRWRVSFVRDLKATRGNDVAFSPGEKVSVAFAVWDGNVSDRNGQKTVSIWNTLILER